MDRRVQESLNFTRKVEKEAIPKFSPDFDHSCCGQGFQAHCL